MTKLEFDIDRVVWDPDYRRQVVRVLNGQASLAAEAPPSRAAAGNTLRRAGELHE